MRSLFVKSSDYFFLHRSLLRLFLFLTYRVHLGSIGLDMLQVVRISQAQGLQRTGRAGRQGEGHCYRMLTKNVSQLNEAIVYLLFRLNEQSSLTLSSSRVSRGLLDVLSRYETDVPTLSNHYVGNLCLFLSWQLAHRNNNTSFAFYFVLKLTFQIGHFFHSYPSKFKLNRCIRS